MSPLTELTLCHWEFISFFNRNAANIWSYCVETAQTFGGISCFQLFWQIDSTDNQAQLHKEEISSSFPV